MSDAHRKILEMLAEKKISVEEAERLISLIPAESGREEVKEVKKPAKYLRISIKPTGNSAEPDETGTVNIRVPVTLMRAGIRLASIIPPNAYNRMDETLKEKGIDFDMRHITPENIDELITALNDLEVDIQDKKQTVHIYAE
ncbi:MAG: hypothetical protein JXA46_01325 [Dehalococcoidales bacterium]|nr:hypothetical protein [Dehalococcoidales bacterium]